MIIGAPPRARAADRSDGSPMLPARARAGHSPRRRGRGRTAFAVAQRDASPLSCRHSFRARLHADQLRRLPERPQARRHPDRGHQRVREAARTASSGSRCSSRRATELDEMAEEFGLHELAVEDARKGHQRPKIEEYGDSLFAVLQPVEKVKQPKTARDELLRRRGRRLRRRELRALGAPPHAGRASPPCARAPSASPSCCKHGSGFVFYALMDNVVDRYFPDPRRARDASSRASRSGSSSAASARANIEALYALKRKLMALKHAVAPLMEAVGKLYGGRVPQSVPGHAANISATSTTTCSGSTRRSKASAKW